MVTVGKIFARQGEIHLCFRLQLKITDLMFNLNINKKTAPLPTFLPAEGCIFILLPTIYSAAYRGAANIYNSDHLFSRISESDKHFAVMSSPFYQVFKLNICH